MKLPALLKTVGRKVSSPVTIIFIPHHHSNKTRNLTLPLGGVWLAGILLCAAVLYLLSLSFHVTRYQGMERLLEEHARKIQEFNATLLSLKKAESDLQRLLRTGSREGIVTEVDTNDMGSVDLEAIQKRIEISKQTVSAVRNYLRTQRDLYLSTPQGLPVEGEISSAYGTRVNPLYHRGEFHRGVDISAPAGTPVRATADGVVSFSGWNGSGGNVVVISHGHGFTTYYAHNRENTVVVGQRVKRGDLVAYVGSTGRSTGNHVHYEIWQGNRCINPHAYLGVRP
ncbi:MAG: M23 family metallopeptidase [Syntrophales bacterium]|nr:M23 family metallopeptidase [Syntrophales bacterium]